MVGTARTFGIWVTTYSHPLLLPAPCHRRSAPSRCGQEYRAVSPCPLQVQGYSFTLKEAGSQHLICLQSYTTEGCSGQARPAGRRCLPWPSFCSPSARTLPQMYPTKDANPSLPCLSLLKGFFRGRRRPGRARVSLWEGNCCPHPQRLCIGKDSALLGMGNVQTLTLFGTKPWQEVIPKVIVENGGARKRGTMLYDVGSNKQKGKPVRNLREPRKTTDKKEKNTLTLKPSCDHINFGGCGRLWACIRLYALRSNLSWMWGGPASIPQAKHRSRSKMWKSYRFKMLKHNLRTNTD